MQISYLVILILDADNSVTAVCRHPGAMILCEVSATLGRRLPWMLDPVAWVRVAAAQIDWNMTSDHRSLNASTDLVINGSTTALYGTALRAGPVRGEDTPKSLHTSSKYVQQLQGSHPLKLHLLAWANVSVPGTVPVSEPGVSNPQTTGTRLPKFQTQNSKFDGRGKRRLTTSSHHWSFPLHVRNGSRATEKLLLFFFFLSQPLFFIQLIFCHHQCDHVPDAEYLPFYWLQ